MTLSTKAAPLSLGSSSSDKSRILPGSFLRFYGPIWTIPWGRNGNPLQYSCLTNTVERGAWWATVHRVTKELNMTYDLGTRPQWACLHIVVLGREQGSSEVLFLWLPLKHSGFGLPSDVPIAPWRQILQGLLVTTSIASPLTALPVWAEWRKSGLPALLSSLLAAVHHLSGDQEKWIWRAFQPVPSQTFTSQHWNVWQSMHRKALSFHRDGEDALHVLKSTWKTHLVLCSMI